MTTENETPDDAAETPAPNRGGAPLGNFNAAKHGRRTRRELPLAELGNRNSKNVRNAWHDKASAALLAKLGRLDFGHIEALREAARHEATILLCECRRRVDGLTFEQQAALDTTIAAAMAAKSRILQRLGLQAEATTGPSDAWDRISLEAFPACVGASGGASLTSESTEGPERSGGPLKSSGGQS